MDQHKGALHGHLLPNTAEQWAGMQLSMVDPFINIIGSIVAYKAAFS